jgi:hypothetical protein
MTGQTRWFFDDMNCTRLGDAYGNKPSTRWKANARKFTKNGGPIFWMKDSLVCPDMYNTYFPLSSFDQACVNEAGPGMTCRADPAIQGSTVPRQVNGTDADHNSGCECFKFIKGRDEIALNCELGLYLNFTVTDGIISCCPGLKDFNASMQANNGTMQFPKKRLQEAKASRSVASKCWLNQQDQILCPKSWMSMPTINQLGSMILSLPWRK